MVGGGRLASVTRFISRFGELRDPAERDCRVRAWLRFGRAPVVAGGAIFDFEFANAARKTSHICASPRR